MTSTRTTPATRFDTFNIYTTHYKTIGTHQIEVDVILPKDIKPGKYPVLAKFHGGALVTGTALYPDWFANFLVSLINDTQSIVVTANYRLLPEHTGADIAEDLGDFWKWFSNSFPTYLSSIAPSIEADFSRILVSGESSGGRLAFNSVLLNPPGFFKAVLVQYPQTHPSYKNEKPYVPGEKSSIGVPIPGPEFIEHHLENMKPGTVISGATPPDRLLLTLALLRHKTDARVLDGLVLPVEGIDEFKGKWPSTWILHGREDDIVLASDSEKFASKVKALWPDTPLRLDIQDGTHGFDNELVMEEHDWLKEGIEWIKRVWLE